jgi:hypothetical protein
MLSTIHLDCQDVSVNTSRRRRVLRYDPRHQTIVRINGSGSRKIHYGILGVTPLPPPFFPPWTQCRLASPLLAGAEWPSAGRGPTPARFRAHPSQGDGSPPANVTTRLRRVGAARGPDAAEELCRQAKMPEDACHDLNESRQPLTLAHGGGPRSKRLEVDPGQPGTARSPADACGRSRGMWAPGTARHHSACRRRVPEIRPDCADSSFHRRRISVPAPSSGSRNFHRKPPGEAKKKGGRSFDPPPSLCARPEKVGPTCAAP